MSLVTILVHITKLMYINLGNITPITCSYVISACAFKRRIIKFQECSLKCLDEQTCAGNNYRTKSKKNKINCQLGSNSSLKKET